VGGFALVDVLVSLTLIGLAGTGILAAVQTFMQASSTQRSLANLDQVVRSYGEGVVAAAYATCASSYPSVSLPAGYSFASGPVLSFWNGDSPATFSSTCTADKGVQRIAATVRENASGTTQQLVVAKNQGG
jgi:hypothetical protein